MCGGTEKTWMTAGWWVHGVRHAILCTFVKSNTFHNKETGYYNSHMPLKTHYWPEQAVWRGILTQTISDDKMITQKQVNSVSNCTKKFFILSAKTLVLKLGYTLESPGRVCECVCMCLYACICTYNWHLISMFGGTSWISGFFKVPQVILMYSKVWESVLQEPNRVVQEKVRTKYKTTGSWTLSAHAHNPLGLSICLSRAPRSEPGQASLNYQCNQWWQ